MNFVRNYLLKGTILFITFLLPRFSFSQMQLKGVVVDSLNAPLPYVSISLSSTSDSSFFAGAVTDVDGIFSFIRIPNGSYFIKANSSGFKEVVTNSFEYDSLKGYEMPPILLHVPAELKEIVVSAFRDVVKFENGMVVMNVENSSFINGNTAFNLLKKMPGVSVDNNYNISINGSGARVMIDGRLQQLSAQEIFSVLNSISATSISKIEVMDSPPAKYDAGGSGGMINIVTKKIKIYGTSGSVNSDISKGEKYRGGCDVSLNYKGKYLTLITNLAYQDRVYNTTYTFNKTFRFIGNETHMDQVGNQVFNQQSLRYKLGADYELSKKTVVGFLISAGPVSTPSSDVGINQVSGYNDLGFDHTPFRAHISDRWSNPNYNVTAEHQFDTLGTILSLTADYTNYKGKREASSENYFSNATGEEILEPRIFLSKHISDIHISTQRLDFKKRLFHVLEMETGIKLTFVNSKNNYSLENKNNQSGLYELDLKNSNNNLYLEKIFAGYINFKKQFKVISIQFGGRVEKTNVNASNKELGFKLTRDYTKFFPTITLDYPRSEKHSFNLSLTRRIDRPNYIDLNPYKSFQDAYTSSLGNSKLIPQTSYNFSFTHSYKHTYNNTIRIRYTSDLIMNYMFQDDSTRETIMTVKNIKSATTIAYTPFIQQKMSSRWNCILSGFIYFTYFKGIVNDAPIDKWTDSYLVNVTNDFVLKNGFKFSFSGFYAGPSEFGINYSESKWGVDMELRRSFLNGKLTVSLAAQDIFYKDIFTQGSKFQTQDVLFTIKNDTRRMQVSINYAFGMVKAEKRAAQSNDQEKDRLEKKMD